MVRKLVQDSGRDENYAMLELPEQTINFEKDLKKAPLVMRADGSLLPLIEVSGPLGKLSELNHIKLKPLLAVSLSICKNLPVRH